MAKIQDINIKRKVYKPRITPPARVALEPPKKSSRSIWLVAFVSALFLFFALSFLFSRAVITLEPKIRDLTLPDSFSAQKEAGEGKLSYETIVLAGEAKEVMKALGEKEVARSARGRVILYNPTSRPQPLAVDTRLEGSNGKIYKTDQKLVIPAKSGNSPGAIEVGIYAAEAGADGNSAPLDFKILGFKGLPKYAQFYGRSVSEITGGFAGKESVVGEEAKKEAESRMVQNLKSNLFRKAESQLPPGFLLFAGAAELMEVNVTLGSLEPDGTVELTAAGTLRGYLLREQELTEKIAGEKEVFIPDIKNLNFTLTSGDSEAIDFTLTGPAKVVSRVDDVKLKADLLGRKKSDLAAVLAQYPAIASARLNVRPFWNQRLPEEAEKIRIIVNYPNN